MEATMIRVEEDIKQPMTPSARFSVSTVQQTIQELNTDTANGLSFADVDFRTKRYGSNQLEMKEPEPLWKKFMEQLQQPLILLLLGSAFVSLVVGQYDDAFSITLAILIVITVAFIQEYRSEKSLESLNKLVPHYCHVLRESHLVTVLATELVPGDIVKISTGDRVPADIRLMEVADLEIDESNLSGETNPAVKTSDILTPTNSDEAVPVVDRRNIGFMGTLVRGGHARGIVVGTGKNTEFGVIWTMMKDVDVQKTPLQMKMDQLGNQLSALSFAIIGVISLIGLLQGRKLLDTFTIAVSLAVAAIPEGLPIVVTVTLALGVMRMANKKAIVKRLPSVESLGSVNVICADKTGTLTENCMKVTRIYTVDDGIKVLNNNYTSLLSSPSMEKLIKLGTLCNNAHIEQEGAIGQPTEIALLDIANKSGLKDLRSTSKKISEVPFSSEQKWMSVKYDVDGEQLWSAKGAPEYILDKCNKFVTFKPDLTVQSHLNPHQRSNQVLKTLDSEKKNQIYSAIAQVSSSGLRVIACAFGSDMSDLVFCGFFAMYDPPRDGVYESIKRLHASAVRVIMITGDSESTAISIAKNLGIMSNSPILEPYSPLTSPSGMRVDVLSGPMVDKMSERQLQEKVLQANVFYRSTPRHKLAIVKALQANGNVVAMTGDGVNDSPALKLADIGISMGISGTDVSKEASDMILVNDDFSTIISAIEEGKSIYYNIRNFLRFQLSTSLSALSLIAICTLFGLPTPLNAMQILWINIIMDGPPAQSLGVEPVDHDVMMKPPRRKDDSIIDKNLLIRVVTSAFFIVSGTTLVYTLQMQDGNVTPKDTTMTFTTFVLFDMFNALSSRSEKKSVFTIGVFSNKPFLYAVLASLIGQLFVIYVPFFQSIFMTEALSFTELFAIFCLSSSVWLFDEAKKLYSNGSWRLLAPSVTKSAKSEYQMV